MDLPIARFPTRAAAKGNGTGNVTHIFVQVDRDVPLSMPAEMNRTHDDTCSYKRVQLPRWSLLCGELQRAG